MLAVIFAFLIECKAGEYRPKVMFVTESKPAATTEKSTFAVVETVGITIPNAKKIKGTYRLPVIREYKPLSGSSPSSRHLSSSFLVDFEEPILQILFEESSRDVGMRIDRVEEYVDDYIKDKSITSLLPASEVAKKKIGDAGNHAVLQAALLRKAKIPARIVQGLLLQKEGEVYRAYGHSWTEAYIDKRWQKVDATFAGQDDFVWHYPVREIEDEGMGYSFSLLVSGYLKSVTIYFVDSARKP